jgi:hypothetical protein
MLLGFISLLLAVGEKPISTICITESENSAMLPCKKRNDDVRNDYCSKRVSTILTLSLHALTVFENVNSDINSKYLF